MPPTNKPTPVQPKAPAAPIAVNPAAPRPLYWCQVSNCLRYTDDTIHNPIGVPGTLYCHPDGAMRLYNEVVGGRIPLKLFKAGDEVVLHFPTGVINAVSRTDSARFLVETWLDSVRELVRTLVRAGVRVILYVGCAQDSPDAAAAYNAILLYASECVKLQCGLAVDAAAAAGAKPFLGALVSAGQYLRSCNLPFVVEGMWDPEMAGKLGPLTTHHVLERQSVERSFTDAAHPAWARVTPPDPSKVVIWDMTGEWSTQRMAATFRTAPVMPGRSAIGAEAWRLGTPGGPRLAVSRQDAEGRRVLGVPLEAAQ